MWRTRREKEKNMSSFFLKKRYLVCGRLRLRGKRQKFLNVACGFDVLSFPIPISSLALFRRVLFFVKESAEADHTNKQYHSYY